MPLALPFRAGVLPAARIVQAAAQATVTRGQLSRALIMARQRNQTEPSIDDDHQPRKGKAIPATPIDAIIFDGLIDQSSFTEVVTAYDFRPPRTIDQITGVPPPSVLTKLGSVEQQGKQKENDVVVSAAAAGGGRHPENPNGGDDHDNDDDDNGTPPAGGAEKPSFLPELQRELPLFLGGGPFRPGSSFLLGHEGRYTIDQGMSREEWREDRGEAGMR
ncbi:hypothetical protein N656DRAFT_765514 [Canariomyces notabilis]|uniref:Uncharacterized protein n=1 Tax=Canariomyces notabilis TaxID=2074819 RepID=A0AAN6YXK8_9PEZI|nr:hypothetical protein N656DRAFT_765514 [Canariomyces arenarius]